jgi:hypothetical protein
MQNKYLMVIKTKSLRYEIYGWYENLISAMTEIPYCDEWYIIDLDANEMVKSSH